MLFIFNTLPTRAPKRQEKQEEQEEPKQGAMAFGNSCNSCFSCPSRGGAVGLHIAPHTEKGFT